MDRTDIYRVYELGTNLHPLGEFADNVTVGAAFLAMVNAQGALSGLLGAAPALKVDLCLNAARELASALNKLDQQYFRDKQGAFKYPDDPNVQVMPWHIYEIRKALTNFEAVFRAEMQVAATYWVPKRGTFDTRDLVDHAEQAFLPELHPVIGEVGLSEYRYAGRSFAFGLWSASGYHSCRAIEAVLRVYYREFTGKDDSGLKTWGDVIKELKKVSSDPKPADKTIFYLEQVKDNDRNPLMHVRAVLDEADAMILLKSADVVIVMMAREIMVVRKAKEQAAPFLQVLSGKLADATSPAAGKYLAGGDAS